MHNYNCAIRTARLKRALWTILAVGATASIGMSTGGCGSESESTSTNAVGGRYSQLLDEFQKAAASHRTYDAYGFASDLPAPRKATIDAFCAVTKRMLKNRETRKLADPGYFADRITTRAKAEAKLAYTAPLRDAVGELRAVLNLDSLTPELARDYVRACY